jgi:hypothetical protein
MKVVRFEEKKREKKERTLSTLGSRKVSVSLSVRGAK